MSDLPKWHNELDIFRKIKPCLILDGNILDSFVYPVDGSLPKGSLVTLTEYLHYYLKDAGYENIVMYDSVRGYYNRVESGYLERFARLTGATAQGGSIAAEFGDKRAGGASLIAERALLQSESAAAIIMNFASRYIIDPGSMQQRDVDGFSILLQACMNAADVRTNEGTLKNIVVIVANKLNDLPPWFYLTNPNVKPITVPTPSKEERESLVNEDRFRTFFRKSVYDEDMRFFTDHPDELKRIKDRFVGLTEGFSFTELNSLRLLSKNQEIRVRDLCSVVDLYKFGIKENKWDALKPEDFADAVADFEKRVKGQRRAINQTLDVIKRAMTGLSSLSASTHGKPKGVLFFAGPTGTGKTETAKTLAEKLFGDENACIRFDMSEFMQPHSDQRLLGAPPGYVGYEAGGQLTNAVKANPFSILLFDEIEKAHPSILDKFLQILEDGRMTDGKGETVYFSESIIIFTSNLGIYTPDGNGGRVKAVSSDMPYEEVQIRVRQGIEDYFKLQLGRPEILNRIGENIVVFDFIRPEVADRILRARVDRVIENLSSAKQIRLSLSDSAYNALLQKALKNLDNGGRGIGNIMESMFINPLARFMFDHGVMTDHTIRVEGIHETDGQYELECMIS